MLSWLIRQADDALDSEPDGSGSDQYEPVAQAIKVGIASLSILLAGLSAYAYRRTAIKGVIFAAVAFGLFAGQMLIDYLEDAVPAFATPYNDIIVLGMMLATLVLFFFAIVWRRSTAK